jgi:hypothetical protein
MFFNLAQVVGLQSFIDPNPNDASAFWGAKHIPFFEHDPPRPEDHVDFRSKE